MLASVVSLLYFFMLLFAIAATGAAVGVRRCRMLGPGCHPATTPLRGQRERLQGVSI